MIGFIFLAAIAAMTSNNQVYQSEAWRFEPHIQRGYVEPNSRDYESYTTYINEAKSDFQNDPPFLPSPEGEILSHRIFTDISEELVMIEIFFSTSDVSAVYVFDSNHRIIRRYLRSIWHN